MQEKTRRGEKPFAPTLFLRENPGHSLYVSMDGRGRCMDNIFTERLWRSYKDEEVSLHEDESPRECRQRTATWFDFYNHARPHQALGNKTPAEVYFLR